MKKSAIIWGVIILTGMLLTGCIPNRVLQELWEETDGTEEFLVEGYGIEITTSDDWEKKEKTNFDIQLCNGQAYFGVMAYQMIDLAEGKTPEDMYKWHNEELFGARENVEVIETGVTDTYDDKTVTAMMYSAENDGSKNYYYSCLVTFHDSDVFAWAMIWGTPSVILNHQEEYASMIVDMKMAEDNSNVASFNVNDDCQIHNLMLP